MDSPARGIRFIHRAIQREIDTLESEAWAGRVDGRWAERMGFLAHAVHLHTQAEEKSIFLDLEPKVPELAAPYLLDHDVEDEQFEKAVAAGAKEDLEAAKRLSTALAHHARLHIRKEEELVVPLLERHFAPAEQGAQIGRMMATFPPADLMAILPWMVQRLDVEDRVAYVTILQRTAPPERLPAMTGLIRNGIGEAAWAEVAARVPGA
jgi:hypothetical protein